MNRTFKRAIICITLTMWSVIALSQNSDDCKYLSVLTYLRTNKAVNEKIKVFFPRQVRKKDKYIDFNLSDRIDFIGISSFKERLKEKKYIIDVELLDNSQLYYKKFYFESYNSDFLKRLVEQNSSNLFLTFSSPINDYLVVELGDFDPAINLRVKYGRGMQMFFKFDSRGRIEDVLFSGAAYN